ncbi:MAG TPA: helix-turn-helix domain-containing protein [Erysipelotrichaceae bacterium]|nr:helix-turn-helix domain-containing protein [Erysipelotrichaceae bacterium]
MDIGERIRQLRVSNDLTQEELASRCELTKGFLSQLENNLATPSLPTLMDIVEALGTTMAVFFTEEKDEQITFDKDDFFVDESEELVITYVVPNAQKNQMEPIIIELQPEGRSNIIYPKEDGETFGYVIKGTVNLVNGKNTYKVKEGGTFYLKCKKEHFLENRTKKVAKILWICTPPLF